MRIQRQFKKSAIGASSVTLVPDTGGGEGANYPVDLVISQVVLSTNSVTPYAEFFGTATGDGTKYLVTIERLSAP